jgi:hypothetical protein
MNTDDDTETWKNLHTGKHIDRTSVYNFGGVDLKNAGITVPQNILADGLVVDIRIAAINRANTDSTDAEIVEADGWRTVQGVPVGHKSAPKSAVTPTVKRDNEQHQGRSGLNVTWPKAEFIVDPLPADDVISYVLVVDDTELPNEIDHTPSLLLGGDLARPGYDDNGLATETTKTYHLYAINDTVNALVSTASVRSFPSGKASLETGRPTKPGAPGSFTVVPDGHTEIKVSWREPAKTPVTLDSECANTTPEASDDGSECGTSTVITGYKIQRAAVNSDGQPSRFTDLATVAKDKMSYTDADLEPGASFFYQVFTMNSQRSSDPTAQKSATTHPAGEPTPPGGLVAQADGHTAIKLCWYEQNVPNPEGQTDEGLPVIGYRVTYLGGADGMTEMTLSENTMSMNTEFTASNLMPDTEYTFRVYSITLGGVGTKYDEASAMSADGPVDMSLGDASGLTAERSTDGNMVMLEWTPGANSNIHWVAVARKNADGSYTGVASLWEQADMQSSHDSDVSALTAGTYVFTVIAGQYNASTGVENWDSQWVRPFAEVNLP